MKSTGASLVRNVAIVAAGLVLLWLSVGITVTLAGGTDSVEFARRIWPWGVNSRLTVAGQKLLPTSGQRPSGDQLARVRQVLLSVVAREPMNATAVRDLAIIADFQGKTTSARALMQHAEALSRREILAELWLIEDAVSRQSPAEAIRHYDRVLAVSTDLQPTLLPILVNASSDRDILRELVPVLAGRPRWWRAFMAVLVTQGTNPRSMLVIARASKLNPDDETDRGLAQTMLSRMIFGRAYHAAIALARSLGAEGNAGLTLSDGDFERLVGLTPFAWWFEDSSALRAYRDRVPNGSTGLWVEASLGGSGEAARRLIALPPGRYRLTGDAGNVSSRRLAQPMVQIDCADGESLGAVRLAPSENASRPYSVDFAISAGKCPVQMIRVVTAPAVDTRVWLDNIAITPITE